MDGVSLVSEDDPGGETHCDLKAHREAEVQAINALQLSGWT